MLLDIFNMKSSKLFLTQGEVYSAINKIPTDININLASNYQKKLDEMGPVEGFGDNMLKISRVIGYIKGMVFALSDARTEISSCSENTNSLITRILNLKNRI